MRTTLEYVFSGSGGMLLAYKRDFDKLPGYDQFIERRDRAIRDSMRFIESYVNSQTNFDMRYSVLYNAFIEKGFYDASDYKRQGFHNLYSDSGGLQVITMGKQVTDEFKTKIYETQDRGEFAFCFDEIPVFVDSSVDNQARATVTGKYYDTKRTRECALKTAQNVRIQMDSCKHTKVFYIVQGNTYNDMIEWFDCAYEVLGSDIANLAGIAVADTCMGNGMLESCDMAFAAAVIFSKYPTLPRRLHLLGIGSVTRTLPFIIACESGLLPTDTVISFDSSRHSHSAMMGRKVDVSVKKTRQLKGSMYKAMEKYYKFMAPIFSQYTEVYDPQKLTEITYADERSICDMVRNAFTDFTDDGLIVSLWPAVYAIYTSIEMAIDVHDNIVNGGSGTTATRRDKQREILSLLRHVRNESDYREWRGHFGNKLQSVRMPALGAFETLNLF